ncbi:uncharacterized protein Z518_11071 [Rhinocladiella mackenziei CBS 650.93]|uniref:Uncharacterized protein n=1 Tax=Rhinocladiella mackenziei CBS 650.93 TaxID=1442369 RepID=A0A0D2I1N8_9EURO|nr:uncharacterized protein Z518_11071 [Rhinocladiella mackenziei CBS 650.93]KIW99658.1 hypothetical protein Z518_11071 [Rhinocladiella mackenziei CBS 650.93]
MSETLCGEDSPPPTAGSRSSPSVTEIPDSSGNSVYDIDDLIDDEGEVIDLTTNENARIRFSSFYADERDEAPKKLSAHPGDSGEAVIESYRASSFVGNTRTSDDIAGRPTLDGVSPYSTESANSVEIPKTLSATEPSHHSTSPSILRVMGKWLDPEPHRYLVLCWMVPEEDEESDSELNRRLHEYDKKILRDFIQEECPPPSRSRKRLPPEDSQSSTQARKRPKTHTMASVSKNHRYPSRQVEENLFLDADVCLADLQTGEGNCF